MNNLGWGWRNTSMISSAAIGPTPSHSTFQRLSHHGNVFDLHLTGRIRRLDADSMCLDRHARQSDQADSHQVTSDVLILGVHQAVLDPGFTSLITVNMYSPDGRKATPGLLCLCPATMSPRNPVSMKPWTRAGGLGVHGACTALPARDRGTSDGLDSARLLQLASAHQSRSGEIAHPFHLKDSRRTSMTRP